MDTIIKDRRALHQMPEIGLDLPRTAEYVETALRGMGLAPKRIGDGIIVDLGTRGPLFAWRADMDALPVQEETGAEYASKTPGRMHACGHDAHTAMALGIARHFSTGGAELPCRLRLIFQPGEEGHGGAQFMIQGGALEGVDAIAGLHVGIFPELPLGCFGTRKGTVMASVTTFEVTFTGKGTHGAFPHLGADALLAACQFGAGLQTVRYGATSPVQPTVVSMGSFHSGTANNVIPGKAVVAGTMRATSVQDQVVLEQRFARYAQGIAQANGVEVEVTSTVGAPITINSDHAMADLLAAAVAEAHGADSFMWFADPTLGAEDFGEYLKRVPGVFFFLGTDIAAPHHHPRFDMTESVLGRTVPVVDGLMRKWAAARVKP
ncbi:MAG: M20 family metallopeptidase [Holophaga sp.]|nr:M20 family metallopeptidase [Holophaga sp.]